MRELRALREDETEICSCEVAEGLLDRAVGLLGRRQLPAGRGLLIRRCSSVHTLFMRFPIDVVCLDSEDRVVKAATLKPFRLLFGGRRSSAILELAAGRADALRLQPGQRLSFVEQQVTGGIS